MLLKSGTGTLNFIMRTGESTGRGFHELYSVSSSVRSTMITRLFVNVRSSSNSSFSACVSSTNEILVASFLSISINLVNLFQFWVPTSSQILHKPSICTISLKFPTFTPSRNTDSDIGFVPSFTHSSLYFFYTNDIFHPLTTCRVVVLGQTNRISRMIWNLHAQEVIL